MKNKTTLLFTICYFLMANSYVFSQTKTPPTSELKSMMAQYAVSNGAYGPQNVLITFDYEFFRESLSTYYMLGVRVKNIRYEYLGGAGGKRFKTNGKIYTADELQSYDFRGQDCFNEISITDATIVGLKVAGFGKDFVVESQLHTIYGIGKISDTRDLNALSLTSVGASLHYVTAKNTDCLIERIKDFEKSIKDRNLYKEYLNAGSEAMNLKNWALAKTKYEQALQLFPNENFPKSQLQKIKQEEDKLEAAKNNAVPPVGNVNGGANSNSTNKDTKTTSDKTTTDKTNAGKTTPNTAQNNTQNTTNKTTTKTDATQSNSNESAAEKLKAEEERRAEEKRIADAKAKAEEDAANAKRQQEYDSWKKTAQADKDLRDAESIAASIGFLTILGGFIYDGMGEVDPYSVYQAPDNKYKPLFYMTNSFGYSFSMEPMLFQSNYSTMVGGKNVNTTTMKGETGYYLNLGGQSNIGFQNDFYSMFGILGGKLGFEPTLSGFKYNMKFGFGGDVGFKNIKFYTTYQYNLADYKSTALSDVEETGEGEYDLTSDELGYGVKFTFGGDKSDDFQRQHIYLGYITKTFNFEGGSIDGYYDPITNLISSTGSPAMEGFNFEWRKDHSFSLFFHYFDEHIYAGTLNTKPSKPTGTLGTDTFFEIGFHRAFDLFTHDR